MSSYFWEESSGLKAQAKLLKQCVKAGEANGFLYTDEELHKMKSELRSLQSTLDTTRREERGGFGCTPQEVSQADPIELQEHL
tara:strand:- start:196 stop:444 length:249 start_codon:yes stop_codon:yes gene_type:complete